MSCERCAPKTVGCDTCLHRHDGGCPSSPEYWWCCAWRRPTKDVPVSEAPPGKCPVWRGKEA